MPAWVTRLPERPTIHASLGIVFHRTPGIFAAILEGLRDEEINLVLAVGRDQDLVALGPQPPNIHIERYIPHTLLLPYCDVVVKHGGFGSVMACVEEGLPMVAIPLAGGDQAGNARRCAALGVARVVAPDERTPEAIREAVLDVLRDPHYRKNAEHLQREIQALPDPEHAVELLEGLAVQRAPLADTSQRTERRYERA